MMRFRGLNVLVLAAAVSAAYANSQDLTMTSQGHVRKYRLHVPASYTGKKPVALVLVLHGRGGQGPGFEQLTGMSTVSDQKGFIVVYPSAIGTPPAWLTDWNYSNANTNDGKFLSELIDKIESHYRIDPRRVYCAGFSAGGFMSYQMAASYAPKIAAIAVVEGCIGVEHNGMKKMIPNPSEPVAVLAFHGKKDTTVPYNGGPVPLYPNDSFLSAAESIGFWVQADGCSTPPTKIVSNGGNVVRSRYANGQHGTDVVFYSISSGKHQWPDPAWGIDAKNVIWTFFANHPKQ